MGQPQVLGQARQPEQQAEVRHHRRGHRPGRWRRRGHARRARVQREGLHLPRLAPSCPLHRRAGRHQRGEELPRRRRQHLPPLLRHREGRRLPQPRGERVPPRAGVEQHHRPVRGAGRALRPRVRRPARQPLVRRRPGEPHLLRRGARPASSSCSAPTRRWPSRSTPARAPSTTAPSWSTSSWSTAGPPASSCATCSPARSGRTRRTRWCWPPAATRTCSSSRRTRWPATSPRRGGPTAAARCSPTRASPRSTRPASRRATSSSRSSR